MRCVMKILAPRLHKFCSWTLAFFVCLTGSTHYHHQAGHIPPPVSTFLTIMAPRLLALRLLFFSAAESHQSDVLCTLATDVGTVSGDLKEVNNRLDNMMSVLLAIASGQHQAASAMYPTPQSEDINTASSATAPTPAGTALGGSGQQWGVGGESGGSGATRQGAHNPLCAHGAPAGYCVATSLPTDQQLRGWQGRSLVSRPTQQPCPAMLYSALPNVSESWSYLYIYTPEELFCYHRPFP